jgi:phosphoribosylaminoimidazolecarboxamide formyltransferase/IMP cyclohydrolase
MNRVEKVDDLVNIKTVLVSLSNKEGLDSLAQGLLAINPDIRFYSTGGTYVALENVLGSASPNLISVSDYTGQPEMQGGLVKTLDFKIYLGLLNETYNSHHEADIRRVGAVEFDMVVVNLYPFTQTIAKDGVNLEDARANIDIGGPTMLRASAKNFLKVASVVNPLDYPQVLGWLKEQKGGLTLAQRFALAKKTFSHTALYDTAISQYLETQEGEGLPSLYQFPQG